MDYDSIRMGCWKVVEWNQPLAGNEEKSRPGRVVGEKGI